MELSRSIALNIYQTKGRSRNPLFEVNAGTVPVFTHTRPLYPTDGAYDYEFIEVLHERNDKFIISGRYDQPDTFRHLMALSTAITITPTSANIAIHMFAIPRAPSKRNRTFMPIAKTIF